ncbi:hypothetical protein SDC9_137678 [bioreactor metagenome]|uniref:Uncharacterized protein n=1 Tax=bioreactor metagenome TaxID=1076179 RepID=A0A645DMM6_9ZZZZ
MPDIEIPDRMAEQIVQMGIKFFSDPKNQKAYEEWHKKEYGCLPGQAERK